MIIDEFDDFLDNLVRDAIKHYPIVIAEYFNAWALDWESKWTNERVKKLLEATSCFVTDLRQEREGIKN